MNKIYTYWDGTPLNWLNLISLSSLKILNSKYNIIIFREEKGENEKSREEILFTNLRFRIRRININHIYNTQIPDNEKSRWVEFYILSHNNGLWIDFDVLLMRSLSIFSIDAKASFIFNEISSTPNFSIASSSEEDTLFKTCYQILYSTKNIESIEKIYSSITSIHFIYPKVFLMNEKTITNYSVEELIESSNQKFEDILGIKLDLKNPKMIDFITKTSTNVLVNEIQNNDCVLIKYIKTIFLMEPLILTYFNSLTLYTK